MAIRFFFNFMGETIQLPVNPPELETIQNGSNKTEDIIKTGQINIPRTPKLKEFTIKSFFPRHSDAPYVLTKGAFKEPEYYIDFFRRVPISTLPCRFVVSDMNIDIDVLVESFQYGQEGGDEDINYTLKLKEYKKFSVKLLQTPKQPEPDKPVQAKVEEPDKRQKTGFSIGDTVYATGDYYYSSWGANPHYTFPKNFIGKISHIVSDKTRKLRYHITTTAGNYRGWVNETQIKHKDD